MDLFHSATRRWFAQSFEGPTDVQRLGWPLIASGRHVLMTAPTGSGKTLAAFLWSIDRLVHTPVRHAAAKTSGVRVLYISPLKALVADIERNLRAPLAGVTRFAQLELVDTYVPRVGIRTGDTSQQERARQLKEPPDILVTTPESLYLLLGSRAADNLAAVELVIVDEVHALLGTKRGVHLALSLERLSDRCAREPQRIGLSATIRPLDEAARFVAGRREVEILDASAPPRLSLEIRVPVPDMEHPPSPPPPDLASGSILGELYSRAIARPPAEKGMWSAIYPSLLDEIRQHRSTIVFVNSRGLCERLCHRLNQLALEAGEDGPLVRAHHGSVSHEQRAEIEDSLKRGALRAIVATSSLEMGIDMGAVDQVLLVESPGSVARGLQRVGRAGHRAGEISKGRIFPKFRGDLLECAVVGGRMLRGEIESLRMPRNALDVLAQQVAAHCSEAPRTVEEIHCLVSRAGSYLDLSRSALETVLGMLSGDYPFSDFAAIKPLLRWDRTRDLLSLRRGAAMIARLNGGTIPDRGTYAVHLGPEGPRVGELDEEMVFETKAGDCVMLGASSWRVEEITRDRVIVSPAPGEPGRLPFWRGDGPGRPLELGTAVGAFCRQAAEHEGQVAVDWIERQTPVDAFAARNLADYIAEQRQATGLVPSDRVIVIERFRDELGDWRLCILSPFGARIHAPWAMAIQWQLERREGFEIQVIYTDDGIVLRLADNDSLPDLTDLLPPLDELRDRVTEQLANTALFASLFRENAARALLMPRRSLKGRQPLWAQRLKAQSLLAAARRYPNFPILLETYRQALSDVFDLPGLETILRGIASRSIRVHEVETQTASPFARSLVFAYVASYIYEQDAPAAERRAQVLSLDRSLLTELLGQTELRELIDPRVLEELEQELQHKASGRQARDADELHDLLRRLGDLTTEEAAERCGGDAHDWLALLQDQRRAITLHFHDGERWIAAEDAGLYRDALGLVPPAGLPDAFVALTANPLETLLRRYAKTHGPFAAREPAFRIGLRASQVEPALRLLEHRGEVVQGEIRPLGSELDWCDPDILRRLRRRTLARARDAVAPVDGATLGRFLPSWQGIGRELRGPEALMEALIPLEGLPLPWSLLSQVLLPARIRDFRPEALDMLAAMGQLVWVGCASAGPKDGRIAVYGRESISALIAGDRASTFGEDNSADLQTAAHRALLGHLKQRGASFLMELVQALDRAGLAGKDLVEPTLWDLVWAGLITNDTFAPLRALAKGPSSRRRGGAAVLAGGRWSLVSDLLTEVSETERRLARARMLLERYGILSREAVQSEGLPGGFGSLYPVLKQMEESGRVRRGYFVEGLSGAQFGLSAAVDRLRGAREEEPPVDGYGAERLLILAAADPASPYGRLLPWPPMSGTQSPKRALGAYLILLAGEPVLYVGPGGRQLLTFAAAGSDQTQRLRLAASALHRLPKTGRQRFAIRSIDGLAVTESPLRELICSAGFRFDYDSLIPERQWL